MKRLPPICSKVARASLALLVLASAAPGTPPEPPSANFVAAREKLKAGEFEEALKKCEAAIAVSAKDHPALMLGMDLCLGLGRNDRGLALVDAHLSSAKPLPRASFDRADFLVRLGRYEEAVKAYTKAIEILSAENPRIEWLPHVLRMRYAVRARLGDGARAREEYREAVQALRKADAQAMSDSITKLAMKEMTEEEFRKDYERAGEANVSYFVNVVKLTEAEVNGDRVASKKAAEAIDEYGKANPVSEEQLKGGHCMSSPSTRSEVALARQFLRPVAKQD